MSSFPIPRDARPSHPRGQDDKTDSRAVRSLTEPKAVTLGEHGNGREVDVELVLADDLADRSLVALGRGEQQRELAEVVLEAGRRDDLEHARGLVACVPERVRDAARLEDEIAGPGLDQLVTELHADAAL